MIEESLADLTISPNNFSGLLYSVYSFQFGVTGFLLFQCGLTRSLAHNKR